MRPGSCTWKAPYELRGRRERGCLKKRGANSELSGIEAAYLVDTCGSTAIGEDGEESGIWSISPWDYDGGRRKLDLRRAVMSNA
jgi:hypothetical protein